MRSWDRSICGTWRLPSPAWGCRVFATFPIGCQQRKPWSWWWGWFPEYPPQGKQEQRAFVSLCSQCATSPGVPSVPHLPAVSGHSAKAPQPQWRGWVEICVCIWDYVAVFYRMPSISLTLGSGLAFLYVFKYCTSCAKPFLKWPLLPFNSWV